MSINYFFINAAILATGGTVTVTVLWLLVKSELPKYLKVNNITAAEPGKKEMTELFRLRLQAYERMIVFVERLNPSNLFIRLYQPGTSAKALQALILNEIRAEYEHNTAQQLYINSVSWTVLCKLKEDTIAMMNNAVAGLPADATGAELSRKVLEHMSSITENPYDLTLEFIKKDIHQLF